MQHTGMVIQLANTSVAHPTGLIENVFVWDFPMDLPQLNIVWRVRPF